MSHLKSICVFCGSNKGLLPAYETQAKKLGKLMVENQFRLIYGGGKIGLMGVIADEIMQSGGEAVGVIPKFLAEKEVAYLGLTELITVSSMHERKTIMSELADAFIIMPGGIGTFEEFFEILTWRQLKLHHKPIGILNVDHYYDALLQFLDHAVTQKFFHQESRDFILTANQADEIFQLMHKALSENIAGDIDLEKT